MNITPVIVRELRSEARNPVNYWIRVIAASLLLLPLAFVGLAGAFAAVRDGKEGFVLLTTLLFLAAWIIIPITVSDCISRERREGTLGLLFLTPLSAGGILFGKSVVNIARSLIVFLAALPILAIPILMGGVLPTDILRTAFFNGAALVLAIAASLLASSLSQHRNRALILGLFLCATFLFAGFVLPLTILLDLPFELEPLFRAVFLGEPSAWSGTGITVAGPLHAAAILFVLSLVILALVIAACAARLKRNWQDRPMSARQQKIYRLFCSPRFLLHFFKRWQQRKLTRNPVGWLQSYSWSARLSTWGWCGLIILVESMIVITSSYGMLLFSQSILGNALLISIAFSAVNSFQRERQTGALELILVTPIQERELIVGRLRGIWEQFLPAFLVLLFSAWYMQDIHSYGYSRNYPGVNVAWFWKIWKFLIIPVVGLYFGLRFRTMLGAWFLTCACCLLLPALVQSAAMYVGARLFLAGPSFVEWIGSFSLLSGLFLLGLPVYAWVKTEKLLRDRLFISNVG